MFVVSVSTERFGGLIPIGYTVDTRVGNLAPVLTVDSNSFQSSFLNSFYLSRYFMSLVQITDNGLA